MPRIRSATGIVHHERDVKFWIERRPSIDEARPGRCSECGGASQPEGGPLGLHGHGGRDRQQRGPEAPGATPGTVVVSVRRYRCQYCGALSTVVPRDVEPRRHYSRPAIAWALALFGLLDLPPHEVRRRVCAWSITGVTSSVESWPTLRRWADAVRRRVIFRQTRAAPLGATARQVAARAAQTAAAHAPPALRHLPLDVQVFRGAALMA